MKPYKNTQEAFDKAYEWARTHNYSYGAFTGEDDPNCKYFNPDDGNRCLVGALLPVKIAKSVKNTSIRLLCQNTPEVHDLFVNVDSDLLVQLQYIHDRSATHTASREEYLARLRNCAAKHGLEVPKDEGENND